MLLQHSYSRISIGVVMSQIGVSAGAVFPMHHEMEGLFIYLSKPTKYRPKSTSQKLETKSWAR